MPNGAHNCLLRHYRATYIPHVFDTPMSNHMHLNLSRLKPSIIDQDLKKANTPRIPTVACEKIRKKKPILPHAEQCILWYYDSLTRTDMQVDGWVALKTRSLDLHTSSNQFAYSNSPTSPIWNPEVTRQTNNTPDHYRQPMNHMNMKYQRESTCQTHTWLNAPNAPTTGLSGWWAPHPSPPRRPGNAPRPCVRSPIQGKHRKSKRWPSHF